MALRRSRFADAKLGVDQSRDALLQAPFPDGVSGAQWTEVCDVDPTELEKEPADQAQFSDLPNVGVAAKELCRLAERLPSRSSCDATTANLSLPFLEGGCRSRGRARPSLRASIALAARENRDAAVEVLRKKYAPKLAALQARLGRAEAAVAKQKEQASHARIQTAISVGSTLLGAILGRKTLVPQPLARQRRPHVESVEPFRRARRQPLPKQNAEAIRKQIADLETEVEAESAALAATEPKIEVVEVKPARAGVSVRLIALGWIPQTGS